MGSTVWAARRLKTAATPAGAMVGTMTTGHHIILLPKLAPSCSVKISAAVMTAPAAARAARERSKRPVLMSATARSARPAAAISAHPLHGRGDGRDGSRDGDERGGGGKGAAPGGAGRRPLPRLAMFAYVSSCRGQMGAHGRNLPRDDGVALPPTPGTLNTGPYGGGCLDAPTCQPGAGLHPGGVGLGPSHRARPPRPLGWR